MGKSLVFEVSETPQAGPKVGDASQGLCTSGVGRPIRSLTCPGARPHARARGRIRFNSDLSMEQMAATDERAQRERGGSAVR